MLDVIVGGIVATQAIGITANIATWCFKRAAASERRHQRGVISNTRAEIAAERQHQRRIEYETRRAIAEERQHQRRIEYETRRAIADERCSEHQAHFEMLGECWEQIQEMRKESGKIQNQFREIKIENESMVSEFALTPEQRLAIQECNDQLERGIQRISAYRGRYLHKFLSEVQSAQHALKYREFEYPDLPESILPDEFPYAGELIEFEDAELGDFPFVDLGFGERGRFVTPTKHDLEEKPRTRLITRYDQEHHFWILSAARADLAGDLASGRAFRESRTVRLGDRRGDHRQAWWQHKNNEKLRIDLPDGLMTKVAQRSPWGTEIQIFIQQSDFFLKRVIGGQEIPQEHRHPAWQLPCEATEDFWELYKSSVEFSDKLLIRETGMKGDPASAAYVLRLSTGGEYPLIFDSERGVARIGNLCGQRLGLIRECNQDFRVFVFRGNLTPSVDSKNVMQELVSALQDSFDEQAALTRLAETDMLELKRYRAVLMVEFETSSLKDQRTTSYSSWRLDAGEDSSQCRVCFQTEAALPEGSLVRIASQTEPIGWIEKTPDGTVGVLVRILQSQRRLFTEASHPQSGVLVSVPTNRELQNKIDAIDEFHSAKCVEGRTQQEQEAFSKLRRELLGQFTAVSLQQETSIPRMDGLDEHQQKAVEKLAAPLPLVLVQGPPGTGKTQVIAFAVQCLLEQRPTARIAIASQANPAVDEAIAKIQEKFPHLKIFRDYSAAAKEKYAALDQGVGVENYQQDLVQKWNAAAIHQNEDVNQTREWLSDRLMNDTVTFQRLMKNILANRSQVVACTLSRLANISNTAPLFDLVIVDEAAKASVPETMIAANCAKRLALVGDHHQLLPFLDESFYEHSAPTLADRDELKRLWDDSLFTRLWKHAPSDRKAFLQIMRRSRPAITRSISDCFYEGTLLAGRDNTSEVLAFSKSLIWIDAWHGRHCAVKRAKSLYNLDEVELVIQACKEVEKMQRKKQPSIAIIAFHREQAASLKKAISKTSLKFQPTVLTVDASQGGQWDVVILSLARTHGSAGFVGNPNRFNVALSRAKDLCVIVGRLDYARGDRTKGSCLKRIADYFQNGHQEGKWISYLDCNQRLRPKFGVVTQHK
ncbi:MAG: AAA family ATPase [Blastochloris sp.]|nr:AAA family ATPase [Blastochloris sp.]